MVGEAALGHCSEGGKDDRTPHGWSEDSVDEGTVTSDGRRMSVLRGLWHPAGQMFAFESFGGCCFCCPQHF